MQFHHLFEIPSKPGAEEDLRECIAFKIHSVEMQLRHLSSKREETAWASKATAGRDSFKVEQEATYWRLLKTLQPKYPFKYSSFHFTCLMFNNKSSTSLPTVGSTATRFVWWKGPKDSLLKMLHRNWLCSFQKKNSGSKFRFTKNECS